jgi:sugar fermentation stimulation protein A
MDFPKALIEGVLVRRYQRFLADVVLSDGRIITAHTPNTGSMKGCCEPGSRVWLRDTGNSRRKYILTWELVETCSGVLVGINTGLPSQLVAEGIRTGVIRELQGYDELRSEVPYGRENSRIDLLLKGEGGACCYVEVKNVTLMEGRIALFPDAVSVRGTKHLRELATIAAEGHRAVMFFCVQRADAVEVSPADAIDPRYGAALRQALVRGVEVLAYDACVSPHAVVLRARLPVVCP